MKAIDLEMKRVAEKLAGNEKLKKLFVVTFVNVIKFYLMNFGRTL